MLTERVRTIRGTYRTRKKVRSSLNPADDIWANLNGWFPGRRDDEHLKEAFMKRAKETSEMEIPGNGGKVIAEWDGEGEESELKYSIRQYEFKDSERTTSPLPLTDNVDRLWRFISTRRRRSIRTTGGGCGSC